jgi:hypothetical protein
LQPYQRQRLADERALVFSPPTNLPEQAAARPAAKPAGKPLPLPGGPKHGVDPIPAQGTPY